MSDERKPTEEEVVPPTEGKDKPVVPVVDKADNDNEDDDHEEGDKWTDAQRKHVDKILAEKKKMKAELSEAKAKLTEKERVEAEAARKADIEKGNWEKIAKETQAKLDAKDAKILRGEVKMLAVKAGLLDPSLLDELTLSGVSVDDQGNILGAEEFIKKQKKDRPYLFGQAPSTIPEGTTTPTKTPTPNAAAKSKDALEMNAAEFAAAKAAWLKG